VNWIKRRSPRVRDAIAFIGGLLGGSIVYFGIGFIAPRLWPHIFPPKDILSWVVVSILYVVAVFGFIGIFAYGGGELHRYLFSSKEAGES